MGANYFYFIDGEPVFVSIERSRFLAETALVGMTVMERWNVSARNGEERKAAARLESKYLSELIDLDKAGFDRDWINFSFVSDEARDNLYRLVDAFISAHRMHDRFMFRDIRVFGRGGLRGDLQREEAFDARWPWGETYRLLLSSKKWWRRTTSLEIEISTPDVISIRGTLRRFEVTFQMYSIQFDPEAVVVCPRLENGD